MSRRDTQLRKHHSCTKGAKPPAQESFKCVDNLDSKLRAGLALATSGVSPWAGLQAWEDWAFHLARSPLRISALMLEGATAALKLTAFAASSTADRAQSAPFEPKAGDRRWTGEGWRSAPYDLYAQCQLAAEHIWEKATAALPGVSAHHLKRVRFAGEKALELFSPTHFVWSNPVLAADIHRSAGACLVSGWVNFMDDLGRLTTGRRFFGADAHDVGRDLALTPGKVVMRNAIMELIQYAPNTSAVRREPVLIVPAWIMKYYILDLAPGQSLIEHLVEEGFTVFCISWKNPDRSDRGRSLEDYRVDGVLAALNAVNAIVPDAPVHAVGYCLGGTMLAIAAAALEREKKSRLRTLTLLAAQTDFSEAGELMMFIDESQIAALEDIMNAQGYLDTRHMAGAFYALRTNDLVWSRIGERYIQGKRRPATEMEVWLADATRMPARMHSEYLRWLFLENRLAQGNYVVDADAVALKGLSLPIFAVGAEVDHIAPWRSVHKIALFAASETTFVLSGGGHNSAIVSPPGKPRAHYRLHAVGSCDEFIDPDEWLPDAEVRRGSWWPEWTQWLATHGDDRLVAPPKIGVGDLGFEPLCDAPGLYVRQT